MRIYITLITFLLFSNSIAQINLGGEHDKVYDFSFSKDGTLLLAPINDEIRVYKTEDFSLLRSIAINQRTPILAMDINYSGNRMLTCAADSSLILWDLDDDNDIAAYRDSFLITSAKFSPDDKLLAVVTDDHRIIILDLENFSPIQILSYHIKDITDIEFIDSTHLISCSADHQIIIWDILTGSPVNLWTASKNWIRDISINKDKSRMASCGDDGRIKLWDISDISNVKELANNKVCHNWLMTCDFYDKDTYVVSGHNKKVTINSPRVKYSYKIDSYVNKVSFFPNRNELSMVVATQDAGLLVVDSKSLKMGK